MLSDAPFWLEKITLEPAAIESCAGLKTFPLSTTTGETPVAGAEAARAVR